VTVTSTIPAPPDTREYLRQARRIRAIHRGNPTKTQQALKNLIAARIPQSELVEFPPMPRSKIDWSTSAVLGHRAPAARLFADQVAEKLLGKVLTYTARQELLALAERLGINRFEANLIIATVQNRIAQISPVPKSQISNFKFPYQLAMFLTIEAIIIGAVWRFAL
jgi:hypothetical protein